MGDNPESREQAIKEGVKWFKYAKGGPFRKWFGNEEYVIDWSDDGYSIQHDLTSDGKRVRATNFNLDRIFKPSISWTVITSGAQSFRMQGHGYLFDGAAGIGQSSDNISLIALLNSSTSSIFLDAINPTLNLLPGYIESLPYININSEPIRNNTLKLIKLSLSDWNTNETAWDFEAPPLSNELGTIPQRVKKINEKWTIESKKQREREIENNRLVAEAYGVESDVPIDVPLERVSLKRNKAFVYPKASPEERDELFTLDLIKELISYAVGCMFGRYSLDEPGLILASQGETIDDFHMKVPDPSFEPDADNVIPMCEGDYFEDDIVVRFRKFIAVAFGAEHLEENIAYIEQVLGKSLRKYFLNDFYNDHVKMYSNRPIYWQYASRTDNKGAFKALVYLHRYTPSTTSTVLAYLRDYIARVSGYAEMLERPEEATNTASAGKRTKAKTAKDLREADRLRKIVNECKAYEDDVLYPLATRNMPIDLDDGVLVNYLRMGKAVRAIPAIEKKRKDVETWEWPVHPLGAER